METPHLNLLAVAGIGVGLSMDALAVSVTTGSLVETLRLRDAFRMAFCFGLFQAIMPIIGWTAGLSFRSYIQDFDHWVAFGLLSAIGFKMIWESRPDSEALEPNDNCLHFPTLLLLSLATSIDALAVGISFALLETSIAVPVAIIGGLTFVLCLIGTQVGNKVSHLFEHRLELIGGVILIAIGIEIVAEHLIHAR